LAVTEPTLGATGWNSWGHDVTVIVNTVETADARLDALEAVIPSPNRAVVLALTLGG
jgi:hypothetical protein